MGDLLLPQSRHGWREGSEPAGVTVNVSGVPVSEAEEAEKKRIAKQRELLLLLTPPERRTYIELLRRAARRQDEQRAQKQQPAIEVQATPAEPRQAE